MNILIPMAGLGQRFKKEGYDVPKFLEDHALQSEDVRTVPD